MIKAIKDNKRNYYTVLAFCIVMMVLFFRSFYWTAGGSLKRKVLEAAIIVFFVVVVPVLCVMISFTNNAITLFFDSCKDLIGYIRSNKKKVLYLGAEFFAIAVVAVLVGVLTKNAMKGYTIAAIGYTLFFVVVYRNMSEKRAEGLFACLALVCGLFIISVTPATPGIMYDDETHYIRTLDLANVFNGIDYEADSELLGNYIKVINEKVGYDKQSRDDYYNRLNAIYDSRELADLSSGEKSIVYVAYIPSAIGIIIGRGLSLSFISIYTLGKVFNLLTYIVCMYFAIKKLKYGKMLFMSMGLLPSLLFMASAYSYDAWVFCFIALGFSYFISMHQSDEKIETKDIILMNIFFFLGFMPKAVYVVMLFPLLFMPKDRFKDSRQRRLYYIVAIIAVFLLVLSFVAPILSGSNTGDHRGGENISVMGQLMFILHNPLKYADVLINFLKNYLSFARSQAVFQFYAYLGEGRYYLLALMTLAVVAFLDKSERAAKTVLMRITALIGVAGGAIIVATTFYLIFSPVGGTGIGGCQPRYILPLIIPTFYFIVPEGIGSGKKKNWVANTAALIMTMTLIYNIYNFAVVPYM